MTSKSASLKAKIRNMAGDKEISPQVLLQNYMFERFLERLSTSAYKDKFVIKGGMLVAAMVGVETRSTMDLDVSIRAYPLKESRVKKAIEGICSIEMTDGVSFTLERLGLIRQDDEYGGFRAALRAKYDSIVTPLSIDITSGDVITPSAVYYGFKTLFNEDKKIALWTYNVETILAEKTETILRRGTFNTRSRDFYDVYILAQTQKFSKDVFQQAIKATSKHRDTTEQIQDVPTILREIENSDDLKSLWAKYQKEYSYAKDISYEDTISTLRELLGG